MHVGMHVGMHLYTVSSMFSPPSLKPPPVGPFHIINFCNNPLFLPPPLPPSIVIFWVRYEKHWNYLAIYTPHSFFQCILFLILCSIEFSFLYRLNSSLNQTISYTPDDLFVKQLLRLGTCSGLRLIVFCININEYLYVVQYKYFETLKLKKVCWTHCCSQICFLQKKDIWECLSGKLLEKKTKTSAFSSYCYCSNPLSRNGISEEFE